MLVFFFGGSKQFRVLANLSSKSQRGHAAREAEMASCAALKVLTDRVEHVKYPGNSNFGCKAIRPPASKTRLPVASSSEHADPRAQQRGPGGPPEGPEGPSHGSQSVSRRSKPQSAIADLYFAEELQACLGHDAHQGLAAAEILPLQSRQQASHIDSSCCAADEPHNASVMLPSGGADWLLFTDAAHLVLDRPKLASENGRSKSA